MGELDDDDVELEGEGPGATVNEKGEVIPPKEESTGKVTREPEQRDEEEEHDVPGSEGYDDREAIRAARREERAKRKQARRAAIQNKDRLVASLQMQVQDLSERLAKVDRRQTGTDLNKLDEDLNRAVRTAEEAKQFMKSTAEAGDWEGNAEATELFYNSRRQAENLYSIKQRATAPKGNGQGQPQVDNRVVNHASAWMNRNPWYKHGSTDTDSIITKAVDDGLVQEGYDPRTPEYWDELDDRLAEKLPHRYKSKPGNGRSSPPVGGGEKNSSSGSGGKGFFLSEARIKAIKEAGKWDDPEARKKMIANYKAYDKEHGGRK